MSELQTQTEVSQQASLTIEERHAKGTSASNAEADLRCPGRFLAQKPFLKETDSKEASHGRAIHEALAEPSRDGGRLLKKLSVDQRETFDRCREIERKFVATIFPDASNDNPLEYFREKVFWCMVDRKFYHSAQPDLVVQQRDRGAIVEYKTLAGDVPTAGSNQQVRDQTVLAARTLGMREIWAIVDQPMVTMSPEIVHYGPLDIDRAEAEMFNRVRKSNDPGSPRLAGEVQCEHCLAKNNCAEYQRFAGAMVPGMLSLLDVPVASWTPEQRGFFCNNQSIAQKWLDETKEAMKEGLAKDPGFVEGWELTLGAVRRSVTDPQSVFTRYAALGGKPEKFMQCVTVQLGKLRDIINDLTGARGKALDAAINTLTEGLIEEKRNAPSLKRKEESK